MNRLKRTSLNTGWEFRSGSWPLPPAALGYSRMEWLPATVPGHVHTDLARLGIILDPQSGLAELGCQWIDEVSWIYRRTIVIPRDHGRYHRILRFEGLDTVCRILIDKVLVAKHDNMFVPLEIDVSNLPEGEHDIEITFEPAKVVGQARRAAYLAKEQLPETTVRFDERAFVRKAQYMFGWDWGPRLISAGIWRDVELLRFEARLASVDLRQLHQEDGTVVLHLSGDCTAADEDYSIIHFLLDPHGLQISPALRAGSSFSLLRPELWWPTGLGSQPLYTVRTFLLPSDTSADTPGAAAGVALDSRTDRLGLRTVELRAEPDAWGESFEFFVNGVPLYAMGANWIPLHSFPSRAGREEYEKRIREAQALGMNMLRIWGGGLYEADEFYDVADELGLLVWQDFPFACSHYPDDPEARAIVREEARVNVLRLRHHPSLAIWCGNNENQEMFDKGWEGREHHPARLHGERLYEEDLPQVHAEYDGERPYVRSSPDRGALASDGGYGDEHYWDVWHGRGDWTHYQDSTGRFVSEFGFASAPGPKSFERMEAGALGKPPEGRAFRFHDKTLKGFDVFRSLVELHYPRATSNEEWLYYSQLNQRDALREAIEHFRRTDYCRGALIWQFNDCYPAQSWSVTDFDLERKAAAFELQRLFQPLLVALRRAKDQWQVWLSLDNASRAVVGELRVTATSLVDGAEQATWITEQRIAPGARVLALEFAPPKAASAQTLLSASFAGASTTKLVPEPKTLTLPDPGLRLAWTREGALEINAEGPTLDLFLWDPTRQVEFEENFITLPAGGTLLCGARGPIDRVERLLGRSLAGHHELAVTPRGTSAPA